MLDAKLLERKNFSHPGRHEFLPREPASSTHVVLHILPVEQHILPVEQRMKWGSRMSIGAVRDRWRAASGMCMHGCNLVIGR